MQHFLRSQRRQEKRRVAHNGRFVAALQRAVARESIDSSRKTPRTRHRASTSRHETGTIFRKFMSTEFKPVVPQPTEYSAYAGSHIQSELEKAGDSLDWRLRILCFHYFVRLLLCCIPHFKRLLSDCLPRRTFDV